VLCGAVRMCCVCGLSSVSVAEGLRFSFANGFVAQHRGDSSAVLFGFHYDRVQMYTSLGPSHARENEGPCASTL
jgi:hypothetical protein